MQLTPTKFLIPAGETITKFRVNLDGFKKGHGSYQAKILKVTLPEAVDAMPEGGYPVPTTWTLNHCPPGDSWYLEASQPITGTHIVQVMVQGAQGSCAALVEIRPRTAEDDVAKTRGPQRRQAASQRASKGRRRRNNRGGK